MEPTALTAWLVAAMLAWAPPARRGATYPDARESVDDAQARYQQIAQAVVDVAMDPSEKPIISGSRARERTALLMLSVAYYESGFRRDVDLGLGKWARGDSGHSWGLWQIRLDPHGKTATAEGWTGPDLVGDRHKAARAGLHKLQQAVSTCSGSLADRLTVYRYGRCVPADADARGRVDLASRWLAAHPVP